MNSANAVNTLHSIVLILASAGTAFGLSIPTTELTALYKGGVAAIGIGSIVISWVTTHLHHNTFSPVLPIPAPVQTSTTTVSTASKSPS